MQTAGLPTQLQPVSHTSLVLHGLRQTFPLLNAMQDQPPEQSSSLAQVWHASPSPVGASPHMPVEASQVWDGGHPLATQSSLPALQLPSVQVSPAAQVPQLVPQTSPQTAPVELQVGGEWAAALLTLRGRRRVSNLLLRPWLVLAEEEERDPFGAHASHRIRRDAQ